MANQKLVKMLRQDVKIWNNWRMKHILEIPDLSEVRLRDVNLSGALLSNADLRSAKLSHLNLTNAVLLESNLQGANLSGANLIRADLREANLYYANLSGANLSGAWLRHTNLSGANLSDADFSGAMIGWTTFANSDLSVVKGLDTVTHEGPSEISINTIYKSKGNISEVFLRGAGVPDNFISYMHSLTAKAFDFYSCFISYSSKDQIFAERLHVDLMNKGVRCWFAPEDLRIGDKIRVAIDESICKYDKLLLVLSKHSVTSDWVEKEVETTLEQEGKQKRTILFPIRLDDTVMQVENGWPADIRRARNIGDFKKWKDHDSYQKALNRLLRDLKAEVANEGCV